MLRHGRKVRAPHSALLPLRCRRGGGGRDKVSEHVAPGAILAGPVCSPSPARRAAFPRTPEDPAVGPPGSPAPARPAGRPGDHGRSRRRGHADAPGGAPRRRRVARRHIRKEIFKKRGLLTGFGLLDSAVSTSPRAALPHGGRLRRRAESARGEVSGAGLVRYKSGRKVGGKFVVGQKKTTLF